MRKVMNKEIIQSTIRHSLEGTATFPQIVGLLLSEGVESYHVDLVRNENRYYTATGESLVEKVAVPHARAAPAFSAAKVAAAIKKSQGGQINYRQFVAEILEAGCVYYIAYLAGKRVAYFGREGDAHVEHFPQK